jgi:hypothetical protein
VGKLTHQQLTRDYIEQHAIRQIEDANRALVTCDAYEQQQPIIMKVLAPKRMLPLNTLPATLMRRPTTNTTPKAPRVSIAMDLTRARSKRRKHDAAAVGHRQALEPMDASHMQVDDAQTQRTYLARSERVAKLTGTLALLDGGTDRAMQALNVLPACHGWLDHIITDRTCTTHTNRRASQSSCTQRQYLTQWRPSLLEGWALEAHQAQNYPATSITPVTKSQLEGDHSSVPEGLHAELYQAIRCDEMCNHTDGTTATPLYTCNQCFRMYHKECMHLSTHHWVRTRTWSASAADSVVLTIRTDNCLWCTGRPEVSRTRSLTMTQSWRHIIQQSSRPRARSDVRYRYIRGHGCNAAGIRATTLLLAWNCTIKLRI